jgi:ABC-type phosphate/phosphonate transport system ATPase subunit
MDNRSTFLYHFYGGKGGTQKDRLGVPIGHGAFLILGNTGAGKSTLVVKLRMRGSCEETQGDSVESRLSRKSSLSLK